MSIVIDKSTYKDPETVNEKWWFDQIKKMIQDAQYGSIELDISLQNGKVVTIKQHTRKSYSFSNGN